jgi:hypothetical protein
VVYKMKLFAGSIYWYICKLAKLCLFIFNKKDEEFIRHFKSPILGKECDSFSTEYFKENQVAFNQLSTLILCYIPLLT